MKKFVFSLLFVSLCAVFSVVSLPYGTKQAAKAIYAATQITGAGYLGKVTAGYLTGHKKVEPKLALALILCSGVTFISGCKDIEAAYQDWKLAQTAKVCSIDN